jgi:hypothetical protein
MCECCPKKPKKFETAEELRYVSSNPLSTAGSYRPTLPPLFCHTHCIIFLVLT